RTPGGIEVLVVDPVAAVRAEPDGENQVPPVRAHVGREAPVGLIGAFVHQPIGSLLGAETMVVDLLMAVHAEHRIAARLPSRRGIAAVEEPRAVMGPGGA